MSKIKLKTNFYEGKELGYSQYFGENPDWYKPFGMIGHNGIDIPTPTGTRLLSSINGTVTETANDIKGYGIYVKIENDVCGILYAHLREFTLRVGDKVKAGDFVGFSGNTGNSTGPHLHFSVHPIPRDRNNGYAGYIDPLGSQIEWVKSFEEAEKPNECETKLIDMRASRDKWKSDFNKAQNEIKNLKERIKILESKKAETKSVVPTPETGNKLVDIIKPYYEKLDGNKTYVSIGAMIASVAAYQLGYISEDVFNTLDILFLALVGFSLRDAIKKK
jgi:murein DD-endopeptidase MepM/ murein hydrolase activator NlpD